MRFLKESNFARAMLTTYENQSFQKCGTRKLNALALVSLMWEKAQTAPAEQHQRTRFR